MPAGKPPQTRSLPPQIKRWPVLVFIHGGWLQIGSPSVSDKLHPHELVARNGVGLDAIVVSVGYRLNVFGFLAGEDVPGNFGFWVRS
jgi:carboxylesterase type B